jgi:diamine N-acetyltransferase
MQLTIREANQSDYAGLCEVFAEVHNLHLAALPQIFRRPAGPVLSAELVAKIIADPQAVLFVAEDGQQVVGIVHISVVEAPDRPILTPRRYATIHTLAVRQAYRGAGIGRALMEQAQGWARDKGASEIELNVWEFNRAAIEFYDRLGYTTFSRKMWITLT